MRAHQAPLLAAALLVAACGGGSTTPPVDAAAVSDSATAADGATSDGGGDTWTGYAMGFVGTYCLRCHQQGGTGYKNGQLDFASFDIVKTNAATIRCGVAPTRPSGCVGFPPPKQFPIAAPYPGDADRSRLVAWIEAGTPP